MNLQNTLLPLKWQGHKHWRQYCGDSLLALAGIFFITGLIALLRLSARIPDCVLLYLSVILVLAYLRGLYPALLASVIAFFTFDFLFVAPLYSLRVTKFDDILTLIVFLVTATITAQLAVVVKRHTEKMHQQMREAQILYEIVCAANQEKLMEDQLRTFMQAIVELFTPWGVQDGIVILCPDEQRPKQVVMLPHSTQQGTFLAEEEHYITQTMKDGGVIDIAKYPGAGWRIIDAPARERSEKEKVSCYIRLIPLKAGRKVVGVLRLLIAPVQHKKNTPSFLQPETLPAAVTLYFSTLLEQAVSVIERERLQKENIEAQVRSQTEELRAALLSSVSHNLRTPLSTIKTAATSIQQERDLCNQEAPGSLIQTILQETDRLDSLVENLLDMSRIEAGVLRPEKDWHIVSEVVYDVLERMHTQLEGRPVSVYAPDQLAPIELDYVHIDQILTNLVENALYYTPEESPLEVRIEEQEEQILVSIADRGAGIPESERERIFSKFYRLQGETTNTHHKGTGLGLAICRGLIQGHGGCIWVEEREGGGAQFCFTLPRGGMKGTISWDA
ncbi:MAG TPA: ATP-binding protein [Ktedonobacteraceae bacterium]